MNYTIKPHEGGRWLASDGIATAEGDDPGEALSNLTEPEACGVIAAGDKVSRECITLIEGIALDAEDDLLRVQVQRITEAVEHYMALNPQTTEEC
jgi:hypothetical protein